MTGKQTTALHSLWRLYTKKSLAASESSPLGISPDDPKQGAAPPAALCVPDRETRLSWAALVLNRKVSSFTAVNKDEAGQLIDALKLALGQAVNPPRRRRPDRDQAHRYGTHGRRGNATNERQLLDEPTRELLDSLVAKLGWTPARFDAFLRCRTSPVPNGAIRTLGDANRAIWPLRNMLRKGHGTGKGTQDRRNDGQELKQANLF